MAKITRHTFSAGKLGNALQTRSDMAQYHSGAREIVNFIPTPQGGIRRRPGTRIVGLINARLTEDGSTLFVRKNRGFGFQSTNGENFFVVFVNFSSDGSSTMEIVEENWLEVYSLTTGSKVYETQLPYEAKDFEDIQYLNINDSLFFAHRSNPIKRLHRDNEQAWIFDDWDFVVPPSLPTNGDPAKNVTFNAPPWDEDIAYNVGDAVLGTVADGVTASWIGGADAVDAKFMDTGNTMGLERYFADVQLWYYPSIWERGYYHYLYMLVDSFDGVVLDDYIRWSLVGTEGSWDGEGTVVDLETHTDKDGIERKFVKIDIQLGVAFGVSDPHSGNQFTNGYKGYLPELSINSTHQAWFSDTDLAIDWGDNVHTRYVDMDDPARMIWYTIFGKRDPDNSGNGDGGFDADISGVVYLPGSASVEYYECIQASIGNTVDNTDYWKAWKSTDEGYVALYPTSQYKVVSSAVLFSESDVGRALFATETSEISDTGSFSSTGEKSDPIFAYGTVEFATEGGVWSGTIALEVLYPNNDEWVVIGTITSQNDSYNGSIERVIEKPGSQVRVRMESYSSGPCLWKLSIPESGSSVYTIEKVYSNTVALVKLNIGQKKWYRTWMWSLGAFGDGVGYPSAFTVYEERLYIAGGKDPSTFYGSQIGDWSNFALGATETSSVSFSIASDQLSSIKWMSSFYGDFIIGTNVGVWGATNRSNSSAVISAINPPEIRKITPDGTCGISPIEVDGALVYITADRKTVKGIYKDTYTTAFTSEELSLLCPEIAGDGFREIVVSRTPYSVIWFMREDNTCATLTLKKSQNILAWADQEFYGKEYNSLSVIRNSEGEDVIVIVGIKVSSDGYIRDANIGMMDGEPGYDYIFDVINYDSLYAPTSLVQDSQTLEENVVRISSLTLYYANNDFPNTYLSVAPDGEDGYKQLNIDWEGREAPSFVICRIDTGNQRSPYLSLVVTQHGELELTAFSAEVTMKTSKGK